MSNVIPCEGLEKGLRIIKRNVKSLIETATLLNSNKKFLHSAIFSIFAIEEMAKAHLLSANHSQKKDVPFVEWDRIVKGKHRKSAHFEKMKDYLSKQPVNIEVEKKHKALYPSVTIDDIIELIADYHVRLKLNVLYVNWDRRLSQWYWLPDDYSDAEQEKISARLLDAARDGYEKHQVT
jgi:AbiV family abortive infection protein